MSPRSQNLRQQAAGFALAYCLLGTSAATEPASPQAVPPPLDARRQLLDLEKRWMEAEDKSDLEALRRILDDRFVATLGAARTYDKEAFIELFDRDADPSASQSTTYQALIIDGDTAVVVGTDTARGTRDGAAYTAVYEYTVTYIRRDGRWRALAEHIVKAPPP